MTERKRAGLDLTGFVPRAGAPEPMPPDVTKIAVAAGFTTRHEPQHQAAPHQARLMKRINLDIPRELHAWLNEQAHVRGTAVRVVILEALLQIGAPIDEDDLRDRRTR